MLMYIMDNPDIVRSIILMLIGDCDDCTEEEDYLFVGTLGSVNKTFLSVTRESWIWKRFYRVTFRDSVIPVNSIHKSGYDPDSCDCGMPRWRSRNIVRMNSQGYMESVKYYHSSTGEPMWVPTVFRCKNIDHYKGLTLYHINTDFKDMFVESAKRYLVICKKKHKLKSQRDRQLLMLEKRIEEKEEDLNVLTIRLRNMKMRKDKIQKKYENVRKSVMCLTQGK